MPNRVKQYLDHRRADEMMRSVRKEMVRNREVDRVRRRDWLPDDVDEWDDMASTQFERVMPRGERERRRSNLERARRQVGEGLDGSGWTDDALADGSPDDNIGDELDWNSIDAIDAPSQAPYAARQSILAQPLAPDEGIVVEVSTGLCRVQTGDRLLLCTLRGALTAAETGLTNVVAAGDRVKVTVDTSGAEDGASDRGMVEAILPRRSALARPDVLNGHLQQVVAANVDQLLAVAAWRNPLFWPELLDRYLITAAVNRLAPLICLNKMDLAEDREEALQAFRPYSLLGYRVFFVSALTGQGIDELRDALRCQTTVLAGLSGVGKSSLLRSVQPGLDLRTSDVSDHWHQGRHTTTQASLHRLDGGGYVIDSPGIREWGLAGLRQRQLGQFYPEIAALAPDCRFADCAHIDEPGCAVQDALRRGKINPMRYRSYRKIYATLMA